MSATSIDAALGLIAYYSGRGGDVDLAALPRSDVERTGLYLALVARLGLGATPEVRAAELESLSLDLRATTLEHPEAVVAALGVLDAVLADAEMPVAAGQALRSLPDGALEPVTRRLGWLAHGLLGDTDSDRAEALAKLSLTLQLVQLEGDDS